MRASSLSWRNASPIYTPGETGMPFRISMASLLKGLRQKKTSTVKSIEEIARQPTDLHVVLYMRANLLLALAIAGCTAFAGDASSSSEIGASDKLFHESLSKFCLAL